MAVEPGLLQGESGLIPSGARDFAGDQDGSAEQEAGLLFFDDLKTSIDERPPARGGNLARVASWDGQPPSAPELGVDEHWKVDPPQPLDQAVEAGGVVEVAVAKTIVSMPSGSTSRRRMFSTTPSGVVPASKRI